MDTVLTMRNTQRPKKLIIFLLFFLLVSSVFSQTQATNELSGPSFFINHDEIIREGIDSIRTQQEKHKAPSDSLADLERWYNLHPSITYASRIETSITIRFIDGSSTVLIDPYSNKPECIRDSIGRSTYERYGVDRSSTAVILNPAENMYGHYHCLRIIATLLRHDYSIEYLANQAVDLDYIRNNLSADIIYMNTHAGYFDIDGDHQADAVVIATGEFWTNETEQKYPFDYQYNLIVRGMVGNQAFVAFTPAFIEYYYHEGDLPNSLVFMATCYALYDTSMAEKFLTAGANVYMGWSQNTVFWTNSRTSVHAFRLLSYGLTVQQVCRIIRSGGFYNWLLNSKLVYHGNGNHRIS
jgi:hypothetical protein